MNEQTLELAVPVGVSGAFLRDRNRVEEIRKLRKEYKRLFELVLETEQKVDYFSDPEWLASFERRLKASERDNLEVRLNCEAERLEEQLADLLAEKAKVRQRILELEPHALDIRQSLVGGFSQTTGYAIQVYRKEPNPEVKSRNRVIDCFLGESNKTISSELDSAFPPSDRPAPQMPDTWVSKYDVKNFSEARQHKKCRRLLYAMISKRRGLMGYRRTRPKSPK